MTMALRLEHINTCIKVLWRQRKTSCLFFFKSRDKTF